MRDIKFKYVIKYKPLADLEEYKFISFIVTLDELQKREGQYTVVVSFLNSVGFDNYNIIARLEFTGLKDKNGKEIYEGDIVCHINCNPNEPYNIGTIQYSEWHGFIVKLKDEHELSSRRKIFTTTSEFGGNFIPAYYVIGNIYENPELLK